MDTPGHTSGLLPMRRIFNTWWPLAASWLLMGIENPLVTAFIARLPEPKINLAAFGGVVFPLSLIIEAPIIMLLAASTALCKDWDSYQKVRRFMMVAGASLTVLHILVAFTPLYYLIVEGIIGAPKVIVEPARLGMMLMVPWSWAIAYRRFNQGVLIRFGYSQTISVGSFIRLTADLLVLMIGYSIGTIPGIAVGSGAIAAGVISEAIYVGIVVRPVLNGEVRRAPISEPRINLRSFLSFYIPLAMTSLLTLLANPIGSAALSRMPRPLESLAVWPVITGIIFMFRGMGTAYNEVVVALLDEKRSSPSLQRFSDILATVSTAAILILVVSPLSTLWLKYISALTIDLVILAQRGLWLALPLPALTVYQSWYQGAILHGRKTRGITESVVIYLVSSAIILTAGVVWGGTIGLYVGLANLSISVAAQTVWLWYRSLDIRRSVHQRDFIQPFQHARKA